MEAHMKRWKFRATAAGGIVGACVALAALVSLAGQAPAAALAAAVSSPDLAAGFICLGA